MAGNKYNAQTENFKPQSYKLQWVDAYGETASVGGTAKQVILTLLNQHL